MLSKPLNDVGQINVTVFPICASPLTLGVGGTGISNNAGVVGEGFGVGVGDGVGLFDGEAAGLGAETNVRV